jgi:hypothetical protein
MSGGGHAFLRKNNILQPGCTGNTSMGGQKNSKLYNLEHKIIIPVYSLKSPLNNAYLNCSLW